MNSTQVVELVLLEGRQVGDELYVLEWEYDRAKDKILYFKLFPLRDWMTGHRDHAAYIVPRGDLVLYGRDESGYISTSNRLKALDENGKFYDEYGRSYTRTADNISLSGLKMQLIAMDLLERLSEEEIVSLMKEGKRLNWHE